MKCMNMQGENGMKKFWIVLWVVLFVVFTIKCFSVEAKEISNSQVQRETKLAVVKQSIWTDYLAKQVDQVKESVKISNMLIDMLLVLLIVSSLFLLFLKMKKATMGHDEAVIVTCNKKKYQVICRHFIDEKNGTEHWISPFTSPKTGAEISAPTKNLLRQRSLKGCLKQDLFLEQKKQLMEIGKIKKVS